MRSQARSLMTISLAVAALMLVCATPVLAHQANLTCQSAQKDSYAQAKAAFERTPNVLDARLQLADLLIADGCFDDALHLLEEGEALHPRSNEVQARLRTTRSMLSEQQYFEGLERAEQAAKLSRVLLRCNKLADIAACDEAIVLKPNDVGALSAKGDALMQAKRPADAVTAYRRAAELAPTNADVTSKMAAAQTQRQALFATCQHENADTALQACDAALMRGADDEFAIHKRKAILLQTANQPAPALDSYIAANSLKHDDKAVALGIVALSESSARKDALALAARGSALLTLGRATDAVAPLRQALTLAPGLAETKSQLTKAERLAAAEARRVAAAKAEKAAGEPDSAVPGESDAAGKKRYSNQAPPTQSN
jgi:tetratricopeptide (TPR) repeat protein